MGDQTTNREPEYRIENGRKIYTVQCTTDSQILRPEQRKRRSRTSHSAPAETGGAGVADDDLENEDSDSPGGDADDPDVVRIPCRLLSAVDAWPMYGFLGPQLVRYGHKNGRALKQIVPLINERARPVPLTWDHSDWMGDKAGIIENAVWERARKEVPAGVNGELVVDREYDQRAAVGLEKGIIDATSISITLDVERSHPDMDFGTFAELAGDAGNLHEVDGEIVGWLPITATKVIHHAMVPAGADPYSGPLNRQAQKHETENAADAARDQNQIDTGRQVMNEELAKILAAICNSLGIEVALSPDGDPPQGLADKVVGKIDGLKGVHGKFNTLAHGLQNLEPHLLREGEASLSAAEILERLPERLELAKHGDAYVTDLRKQAVKWFDSAKVQPDQKEMSAEAKQIRDVIQACNEIDKLKAWITEYKGQAEARFGGKHGMRSSIGEELPPEMDGSSGEASGREHDIAAGVDRLGL